MKVFILLEMEPYEGGHVKGVYKSLDAAEKAIPKGYRKKVSTEHEYYEEYDDGHMTYFEISEQNVQ